MHATKPRAPLVDHAKDYTLANVAASTPSRTYLFRSTIRSSARVNTKFVAMSSAATKRKVSIVVGIYEPATKKLNAPFRLGSSNGKRLRRIAVLPVSRVEDIEARILKYAAHDELVEQSHNEDDVSAPEDAVELSASDVARAAVQFVSGKVCCYQQSRALMAACHTAQGRKLPHLSIQGRLDMMSILSQLLCSAAFV